MSSEPEATITVANNRIFVRSHYRHKERLKAIDGARWDGDARAWTYRADAEHAEDIATALRGIGIVRLSADFKALRENVAAPIAKVVVPTNFTGPLPTTQLWQHQRNAIEMALPHQGFYLAHDMGAGKTLSAIAIGLRRAVYPWLILAPKRVVSSWKEQMEMHAGDLLVPVALDKGTAAKRAETAKAFMQEYGQVAIIINYEAAISKVFKEWSLKQKWGLVILDECHPAGVMISTPHGERPIESLRTGDAVYGIDHASGDVVLATVTHTFQRDTAEEIISIGPTRMTSSHPVWTEARGYVPASEVGILDTVCYIESRDHHAKQEDTSSRLRMVSRTVLGQSAHAPILREVVCHAQRPLDASGTRAVAPEHESTASATGRTSQVASAPCLGLKPTSRSGERTQSSDRTQGEGVRPTQWRERHGTNAPTAPLGATTCMADRVCSDDGLRLAATPLQTRLGRANIEDCCGDRRGESSNKESQRCGQPQRCMANTARLDSHPLDQCGNIGEYRSGSAARTRVYNIETTIGNYFAGGLLVHNSHRIKAPGGVISKYCATLSRRAQYRLCLSGTPFAHGPQDIYGQFRFLAPEIFGTSYTKFKVLYTVPNPYMPDQIVDYQNLDDLQSKFYSIADRVMTRDVVDLPDERDIAMEGEMSSEAWQHYRELERDFYTSLSRSDDESDDGVTIQNILTKLLRLQQLTGGYLRDDDGVDHEIDTTKAELLADVLEGIPQDEPVVVFAKFRHDLDTIRRVATDAGRTCGELSGRIDDYQRWRDGAINTIAIQLQAGGEGLNALVSARYCVYFSVGYSLKDYNQSRARIIRPGQTRNVTFYHLICKGTIDETVYRALSEKQEIIEEVLRRS